MWLRIPWMWIQSTIATLWLAVAKSFETLLMNMVAWWWASLALVLRVRRSQSKEPKNVWKQPKSACWKSLMTWLVGSLASGRSYFLKFLTCTFSDLTNLPLQYLLFQDAQVTIECVIPQKFHRSIMGPKGSRIQQITRDHNVQIKFPEREETQGNQNQ